MRIDSNQNTQPLPDSQPVASPNAAKNSAPVAAGTTNPLGEDQAQLSGIHVQIQSLVAQVAQLPETSQDKINALRQAIGRGSYQPNPEKVASALFESLLVGRAA